MNRGKQPVSRRSVLTGLTAAVASAVFVNTARQSPAQAATGAPATPPLPHPPYHSIVGVL